MSHASWELGWCVFKGWPTIPGRQSEKFIRKDGENVVEIAFRSVAKKMAEWTMVFMVDIAIDHYS